MSYLTTIDPPGEGAVAEVFAGEQSRWGYVPNLARTFAFRPDIYSVWTALNRALKGSMSARRYELVTLAAAATLRSSYCSLAHGEILARDELPTAAVAEIAAGGLPEELTPLERELVVFARSAARSASEVGEVDIDRLRSAGLVDAEIFDAILVVGARCFFSTVLDASGTAPDREFRALPGPLQTALAVGRPIAPGQGVERP